MQSITIEQKRLHINLIRTARRTIQLKIVSPTELEVRAPFIMPTDAIRRFVISKQDWLLRHLKEVTLQNDCPSLPLSITLRGRTYPIQYHISDELRLTQCDNSFILVHPPVTPPLLIRQLCESYYRQYARNLLTAKTVYWAKRIGVSYNHIAIKSQKTRWGSCSAKGNLNYNWHIACTDDELIDYIVIHELCHLRHLNHSPAFWQLVASHCPSYRECRSRLRTLTTSLMSIL